MQILKGHLGPVHTLVFSADGMRLATVAGRASFIWIWNLASGERSQEIRHTARVRHVAFHPMHEDLLAFSDSAGNIFLHREGKSQLLDSTLPAPSTRTQLAFTPDGQHLIASCPRRQNRELVLPMWDVQSQKPDGGLRMGVLEYWWRCGAMALTQEGKYVAAGTLLGWVRVWNCGSGVLEGYFPNHRPVHHLAFSPDGEILAVGSENGLVRLCRIVEARTRLTLKGEGPMLHGLAFSPEGQTIATASGDGKVRLWDAGSGQLCETFDWGLGEIWAVAFAPDGMRAAIGGRHEGGAGDVLLWDVGGEL